VTMLMIVILIVVYIKGLKGSVV